MGQGCTKCTVGNPCTDPKCARYGSKYLRELVEQVREKFEDFQEASRAEEQNQKWLDDLDRNFEQKKGIWTDGFKYYANNVREYFNTPQPKIDDLENVEYRVLVCMDSHTHGEYMECTNYAQELVKLATAGRDPPAHCKGKQDSYSCTFASTSVGDTGGGSGGGGSGGGGSGAKASPGVNPPKSQSFGSCYS